MDTTACTRVNRQGNYCNYPTTRTNVASAEWPFKGKCFNCDMEGHISWNCKAPRHKRINTANTEEWATLEEEFPEQDRGNSDDRIESSIRAFSELSLKEKGKFIARMNQGESPQNFQKAWSVWPWSGQLAQIVYTVLVKSSVSFNTSIFAHIEQEGRNYGAPWFRSHWKLYNREICAMALTTLQTPCHTKSSL